jgi:hypothetical protein
MSERLTRMEEALAYFQPFDIGEDLIKSFAQAQIIHACIFALEICNCGVVIRSCIERAEGQLQRQQISAGLCCQALHILGQNTYTRSRHDGQAVIRVSCS